MIKNGILIGSSIALLSSTSAFQNLISRHSREQKIDEVYFREGTGGGGGGGAVLEGSAGTVNSSVTAVTGDRYMSGTISISCEEIHTDPIYCEYRIVNTARANEQIRVIGATVFTGCASGSGVVTFIPPNTRCGGRNAKSPTAMNIFAECWNQRTGISFANSPTILLSFQCAKI